MSIQTIGQSEARLLLARVIAKNFDIFTGEETLLYILRAGEETLLEAIFAPAIKFETTMPLELLYLSDLNQEATFIQEYRLEILPVPPPPLTEQFVKFFGH